MQAYDADRPLNQTAFAVFDVETTGLHPAYGHRVCEVACIRLEDGVTAGSFASLVDPQRAITAGAFRVNRITAEMLQGAPVFADVARPLLALMEGAVLVAHNAPFDLGFLAVELEIAGMPPPEGAVVDTLTLSRRAYSFARNSLGAVARSLDVESSEAHRAMGDALTTSRVLMRLLWDLDRRWGVTTLGQLIGFQGGPIPYPLPSAVPLPPAIAEALESQTMLRIRYVDARGQETHRSVRLLRVHERRGQLYLLAHCTLAGELRSFRLDRVAHIELDGTAG